MHILIAYNTNVVTLSGQKSSVSFLDKSPDLEVQENIRWLDEGNIITSAGVSAGIDMALHILARLYGPDVARTTARNLEYDYWD